MNASGMIRGYLAKNQSREQFLHFVLSTIEKQLKEWDEDYKVMLLKLRNYELIVQNGKEIYNVTISEEELEYLQSKSPFSLDRKIWDDLKSHGITVRRQTGNYLEYVYL
ncbi:hypothetical protein [Salirhabdus sp. Marseille-P4669]|uniref:hypothetical protein n=1 Tax=Salirhabdus sp. Marseille-P4669 TaxID=2042310 RepID=UPI000C7AA02F|nr:hypothetical protein [Salirhabdus sp. Marseille-P4669]